MMVGVLKNREQYEVNLNYGFYHIPVKLLTEHAQDVRYIALYRSGRFFGREGAGVREYGRVERCTLLPRKKIMEIPSQADEPYYRFDLVGWEVLDRPVSARALAPGVSMFTTRYLLHRCRYFPELYIRSAEHWRLYVLLQRAAVRTLRSERSEVLPSAPDVTAMIAGYSIGVYTRDGRFEQYDLREFYHAPYEFLQTISKYIGGFS